MSIRRSLFTADGYITQCDRELPECRKCTEAGAACIQRRMGVVLDPSQPEPTSWIERLQVNVQRLELEAAETQESLVSPLQSPNESSNRETEDHQHEDDDQAESLPQSRALETAMHDMDYLPLSAMAELRDRQQISLHQYSFETFLSAATNVAGSDPACSSVSNNALFGSLEAFYQNILPSGLRLSRTVADQPVHRYLATCEIICPFLERNDFLVKYAHVMDNLEKGKAEDQASRAPHDMFMVYIVIATGILLSPDFQHKESFVVALVQSALRLLNRILSEAENVCILRSLIALTTYSFYSPLGGSTWHLIGLALARTMSSGMHTSGVSDLSAADPEKNENGRLFWSIYILDA